jgi:hypothetical protein
MLVRLPGRAVAAPLLLLAALSASACRESAAPPSTSASTAATAQGHPTPEIPRAFHKALEDGRFATHLGPLVHPDARGDIAASPFFQDNETATMEPVGDTSHVLVPLTEGERADLGRFFNFSVPPTHRIEFTVGSPGGGSSRQSLYLVEAGESRWFLAVPLMRGREELAAARTRESLVFRRDTGLWKMHWNLQFDASLDQPVELVVLDAADGAELAVLMDAAAIELPADQKLFRLMLQPDGSDGVFETAADGGVRLPHAWQVGPRAASDFFELPLDSANGFTPNESPALTAGLVELATFTGTRDGAAVTCRLAVRVGGGR